MPSKRQRQQRRATRRRTATANPGATAPRPERSGAEPRTSTTRTRTPGPNVARRAAKIQSRPARRFPIVPLLIGAVALALVGTFLFQRLGDDDDSGDGANGGVSGTQLPGAESGQLAPGAAATPGASPVASPITASGCWSDQQTTTGEGLLQWSAPPQQVIDPATTYTATIATTAGDIVVTLDPARAPTTVNNFVCLAAAGYYDNTPFHRIIQGFMIQGGDPTGTGSGGPGYQFADELPQGATPYVRGTIAMANSGPNTNGSQFFIVHQDQPAQFPSDYSIFGQVTGGMEVVDALAATPVQANEQGEPSVPTGDVRILSVTISER